MYIVKSKITKIQNSEENQIGKFLIMAKSNDKTHPKRMNIKCHIPDFFLPAFLNVENGGLNLILQR